MVMLPLVQFSSKRPEYLPMMCIIAYYAEKSLAYIAERNKDFDIPVHARIQRGDRVSGTPPP